MERYFYAQLEDALVNDAATLEQLREMFLEVYPRPSTIQFDITITYDFNPASNCSECVPRDSCKPALNFTTETASDNTTVTWRSLDSAFNLLHVLANVVTLWCTHGLSLAFHDVFRFQFDTNYYGSTYYVEDPIKFSIKLECQPDKDEMISALEEFFRWLSANFYIMYMYTHWNAHPFTFPPSIIMHV